jgi:hypothetical protein
MIGRMPSLCIVILAVMCAASNAGADAPAYNIYELQITDAANNWESSHKGEIVQCVGGIVTHRFKQRIVLQDPSLGSEWAAIEVRGYPVYPTGIEVGDQVDFDSVYVDEYVGVTLLQYYNASSHVVHSSGNPIPDATPVGLWDIRYPPHPEDCEKYASVLISVEEEMTVGAMDLGKADDNYELLGTAADTAWASDYGHTGLDTATYYVTHGECYREMVGILQRYRNAEWDYYQLLPRGPDDYVSCLGDVTIETVSLPEGIRLEPGYPNPFNPSTVIPFSLSRPAHVTLSVFDVGGRRVTTLLDRICGPGRHEAAWNGTNDRGIALPSGVYLVRLAAGKQVLTSKLCLLR